jgi:epidermal growth factor receptor substrate 15
MSSAYDQQIKKLIDHIQTLNQALHERNMQIVQWQQVARAVQDERARIARTLLEMLRQALSGFATKFQGLRAENKKLRVYIDHQKQLHEVVARDLQGQLQYALTRIDELASERASWRQEVHVSRAGAQKAQQELALARGLAESQQGAIAELKRQVESAMVFQDLEEQYKADMKHLEQQVHTLQSQLASQDQAVAGKDRELARLAESFEAFKLRANQEVQAMQAELATARASSVNVDDRVEEMTKLLANSEREVIKLQKDLMAERARATEAEIQLDAMRKDLRKTKTSLTKLEKAEKQAKGEELSELRKRVDEEAERNAELQEQLKQLLADKTSYMQALEGQKGKLRPLQPPADGAP